MSDRLNRRSFLRGVGGGTVGVGIGIAGVAVVHSASHALSHSDHTEVDIGFCTDMSTHHIQAMAMCQRVLGRDTGSSVQAAAVEVLQTQAVEVGMMRAWLTDWGAPTSTPEVVMAWMDHEGEGGIPLEQMPGLATDEQMMALSVAEGLEQGQMWLELMRTHHLGGIDMAAAAIEMASEEKVRRLASIQVEVQTFEVSQYDELLVGQYA